MWIMDLNDDVWPQAPAPNPFIPLSAQKRSVEVVRGLEQADRNRNNMR